MSKHYILTQSGLRIDYADPKRNVYNIMDIAHGLANTCRFGGQFRRFYSVAEHSVIVSHLVHPDFALYGLLHDAAEAYLGDVPTPLKRLLPDFCKIETEFEDAMFGQLGIELECVRSREVKVADLQALYFEKDIGLPPDMDQWPCFDGLNLDVPKPDIQCHLPWKAKAMFLDRFRELCK